jgi:uncharacterized membrane protein (DUF373 family)
MSAEWINMAKLCRLIIFLSNYRNLLDAQVRSPCLIATTFFDLTEKPLNILILTEVFYL